MATIRQRQNKSWQVIIRRKGFPQQSKVFIKKEDAVRWARVIEVECDKGWVKNYTQLDSTLFSDLILRYLEEVSPTKRSYERELSRLRLINRHLGPYSLSQLNPEKIALFRDLRLSEGCSGATVIKDINSISHIIEVAKREWGYHALENPAKLIRKPKASTHRIRRLTLEEEDMLLKGAKQSRSLMLEAIIVFAIETGMRLGEILSLAWSDIDESIAIIHQTKNGESREVPLSKKALLAINKLPKNIQDRRIFWVWNSVSSLQSLWQRLMKKSNISNLRFHDLRHEAISRLFEKGLNVMEVASISGHKNVQVLKRYTHIKASYLLTKINVK